MTDKAAFAGTYADFKTVKTRSTFQVIVEMPIEQAERFVSVFGMPIPGKEQPVALALLRSEKPQEKPRKSWDSYTKAQQAGILCADKTFQQWMDCPTEMETIAEVRCYCGVKSRTELDLDTKAGADWDKLVSKYRTATGQMAEAR